MAKLQKSSTGRVLSPAEIDAICFYDEYRLRVEIQADTLDWVLLEICKVKTPDEISALLGQLSINYPGQQLRAIDMATGRLLDMT